MNDLQTRPTPQLPFGPSLTASVATTYAGQSPKDDRTAIWHGTLHRDFLPGTNAFGGHLFAMIVNASLNEAKRRGLGARFPDPALFSASILRPGLPGPVAIELTMLRAGGRFAVFSYTFLHSQPAEEILVGTITLTSITKSTGSTDLSRAPAPSLPARSHCPIAFLGSDTHPNCLVLEPPPPHGIETWHPERVTRMPKVFWCTRSGEEDPLSWESLAWWSDMVGAKVMGTYGFARGSWAATIEAQVQFLSAPEDADGRWVRVSCTSKYLVAGRMDFEIEVWNEMGTKLFCVMRQGNVLMSPLGKKEGPKI